MAKAIQAYLVLYNASCLVGWAYAYTKDSLLTTRLALIRRLRPSPSTVLSCRRRF